MIELKNVSKWYGSFQVLTDCSTSINKGEVVVICGPSGSGKSTLIKTINALEPFQAGEITVDGRTLNDPLTDIGIVFQDHLLLEFRTAIENVMLQAEIRGLPLEPARKRAEDLFGRLGIAHATDRYPRQLSGGMRQRVVIALALAAEPDLVIADEPTTALDVSVQAQIIEVLKKLCRERGTAVMLITHDMGVIAETADRVAVMYAGRVAEIGPVRSVVQHPQHPYAQGLMGSIPPLDQRPSQLQQIEGSMPRLSAIPKGCAFHPRCPLVIDACHQTQPELRASGESFAACIRAGEAA
jgi:peptide/nickel transport system ATP-binding protein